MRLLACGGDGTAGWVLSVLDSAGLPDNPPVGVLPLGEDFIFSHPPLTFLCFPGTGNDLSRSLGWGGGYMDEPLEEWLANIQVKPCSPYLPELSNSFFFSNILFL